MTKRKRRKELKRKEALAEFEMRIILTEIGRKIRAGEMEPIK